MVTIIGGISRGKTSPVAWIPARVTEGNTHWDALSIIRDILRHSAEVSDGSSVQEAV